MPHNVVAVCDGSERGIEGAVSRRGWEFRPAIGQGGTLDQRLGKLRAIVRVGHHHEALAACRVKDQIALIANILAAFHEHEGGAVARDRSTEPVRPTVLARQHLLQRLAAKKDRA